MSNVLADRVSAVNEARAELISHCMVANFDEGTAYLTVIYPPGHYPDGVRVSAKMGKLKALQKLLEVCERHWKDSMAMFNLSGAEK